MTDEIKALKKLLKKEYKKVNYLIRFEFNNGKKVIVPSNFLPDKDLCIVISRADFTEDLPVKKCKVSKFDNKKDEELEIVANYLDR